MRVSTSLMFNQGVTNMNRQQSEFMQVGNQIASGKRVVNLADDPQAASQAVRVEQSKATTQQHMDARVSARNSLQQQESILNSVSDTMTRAKTLVVQASSGTLADGDRRAVASELEGLYEAMVGLGNSTDGNGRYLFGGYEDSSAPFVRNEEGQIDYVGDQNTREQKVDSTRLMPTVNNGERVFQSVFRGAPYVAEAPLENQGNVTFDGPELIDSGAADFGESVNITFSAAGEGWEYQVNGGEPQAYDPAGTTIREAGHQLALQGEPAAGDAVSFGPAQDMNTDIFRTFERALTALAEPAETPADQARMENTLRTTMRELDNGLDNVLTVRAATGARLNELDALDAVSDNRMLAYEQTLSNLVDLDYAEAAADYSLRMVGLQASQQAFTDVKGMSLFNYL